jgi:hypothetical protein
MAGIEGPSGLRRGFGSKTWGRGNFAGGIAPHDFPDQSPEAGSWGAHSLLAPSLGEFRLDLFGKSFWQRVYRHASAWLRQRSPQMLAIRGAFPRTSGRSPKGPSPIELGKNRDDCDAGPPRSGVAPGLVEWPRDVRSGPEAAAPQWARSVTFRLNGQNTNRPNLFDYWYQIP